MGEHLVVNVDHLPKPDAVGPSQPVTQAGGCGPSGKKPELVGSSSSTAPEDDKVVVVVDDEDVDEQAPLIGMGECRICQDEDSLSNLEIPCACSGSLKYAHRKCVQHWCDEKGDITCEICHQPYQPGYTAPPRPPSDETSIDVGGVWQISGTPIDMNDPRLLAIAEAERQLFDADYDDYSGANSSGTAFCRSAALILMALLLLRHALSITDDGDGEDDTSTFFSLFLLRAVGFLLPCYIMIWAISILQRRRQRQEAAALAAARFAIVVQAAQSRGLLVTSTAPTVASQAIPHMEHA
ncbi:Protein involved in mRNA turnover and stability [Handroanthus impetiginosus]|uniref:Protein involved in mRNA turnover and stability n=1 Tax=Handroanthus impetiginosus TaxID=429701 RepID=A0A2G9I2U1_9LAMI|nr:Protein involved in mRNA turnover and stability [Handroanthus impetiginosus]